MKYLLFFSTGVAVDQISCGINDVSTVIPRGVLFKYCTGTAIATGVTTECHRLNPFYRTVSQGAYVNT